MAIKLETIDLSKPPEFYWAIVQFEYGRAIRGIVPRGLALLMKPPYIDPETELSGVILNGISRTDGVTYFNCRIGEIKSVNLTQIMTKLEVEEIKKTLDYHLEEPIDTRSP